jgi:hypothetical protein
MSPPLVSLRLPDAPSEQAMLEGVLDDLAVAFDAPADHAEHALLVVSEDAGSATALRFWSAALATGVALASPASFAWCLANAPAALLARRFGLRGPNLSWLVDDCGRPTSYAGAVAWLAEHAADGGAAWLAALRFAAPARLVLWRWTPHPGASMDGWHETAQGLAAAWRAGNR